ncbi:putative disease resistance protein RGA1 [Gossypium hirsutum]|uniref:Disease resistance protein RGA1 n=1 Tax=Gossypium hirsutum TaxID=3635 RepID=A0ABM2Z633_GOSHI|nr:putative disease resistance protein RGA1 [Gossypium hirsutum]
MAEAIASDIAAELVIKLSSRAFSQIGLWWNLKDDLNDLKRTVSTIKAVLLDAEEKSVTNNLVKVWLEELKDVLYDADDLLDDFSTEALRNDLMGGNKLMKEVRLFFSSSNHFAYGLKMGLKIKAIKARLASIGSEANTFGFTVRDRPVETSFMTKKRQKTHSFKDKIIGREDDKAALLKLVLEFESEENVYSIPIVGFGGLGKTALAQFVYNDKMVYDYFELRMWVAKVTSKCQPHVLKGLSDDDAWSLFKEIAFEQRYSDLTNSAFVEIGKQILERCSGVPLVIKAIASTLSYKETEKEWSSFKDNELVTISQNDGKILSTLKLSYDNLPSHLKHCFAYCRLYPKDHQIHVKTLIQFWIAQGFIKQLNPSQSFQEIGFGYFKDLVERSLFQEILPHSICKIQNLLALKLDCCSRLQELPKKIEKLVNLTHLACRGCSDLTHMPRGIGKLSSLETLSMFVVDKDGSHGGADLSELSALNNLREDLTIKNLGFVQNAKEKFKAANLKEKQRLRLLVLEWNGDNDDDDKSLEDLQPHPNLKELCIRGWRGDAKFPSWISLLTNLVDISIYGPSKFKHLPSFAQFPFLQQLKIFDLTELECMDDNGPKGSQGESESFFPSLKYLRLHNCPNMKSWWRKRSIDDSTRTTQQLWEHQPWHFLVFPL